MIDSLTLPQSSFSSEPSYKLWENSARKTTMRLDPQERTAGPIPYFGFIGGKTGLNAQHAFAANTSNIKDNGTGANSTPTALDENTKSDFEFNDVLDIINPLQHLPIIGSIYRNLTGDVLKPMSNIIGGSIFGGPLGAVTSTINVIIKNRTGKDLTENALSVVGFNSNTVQEKKPEILFEVASEKYETTKKNFGRSNINESYWNA